MAYKWVDETKLNAALTASADAIREKTGDSEDITFDLASETGFADAIEAIPSGGGGIDMSVTPNQIKAYVYIPRYDRSIQITFACNNASTGAKAVDGAAIDWGDGIIELCGDMGGASEEYTSVKTHNYGISGKYLITITASPGNLLKIDTRQAIFKLLKNQIYGQNNNNDTNNARKGYNLRIQMISIGLDVVTNGISGISPGLDTSNVPLQNMANSSFVEGYIPDGTASIESYAFHNAQFEYIKFPSTLTEIKNNAFDNCLYTVLYDFTEISLAGDAFPIVLSSTNPFRGINGFCKILFATQEIANAAKNATNWSTWASYIHYVGEEDA